MENQKALVDAGVNNPFSFVTFDRFFSNKQLLLLVEILGGGGGVCVYMCVHSHKFPVHDAEFLHLKAQGKMLQRTCKSCILNQTEHKILHCHVILVT